MSKNVPRALKEFSVIYTDRATNLMSGSFKTCMNDIMTDLQQCYKAKKTALIPGSGTMGMEAVARQFAQDQKVLVVRNGFFSYRWSQIYEMGKIPSELHVMQAKFDMENRVVTPPDIKDVVREIQEKKPSLVCLPHVETSCGLRVNNDYIIQISDAVRKVGGLTCLDGIASGTLSVDLEKLGIDLYCTAPQKGWSSPASCAVVMIGERALEKMQHHKSDSFSLDLEKWVSVSDAYASGAFMYHTTTPTDALLTFRDNIKETKKFGYEKADDVAWDLGQRFRSMLEEFGYKSVAGKMWKSPTVIVSHCKENMVPKFIEQDIQVAGSVPLMISEPKDYMSFRIGLFGLDKLRNPDLTIETFREALSQLK